MKFKILFLALVSGFILSACDKKAETAPAPSAQPAASTQQAAPAEQAAPTETVTTTEAVVIEEPAAQATADADSTGIAECDEYLTKVMACYETKLPEAARGAMVDGLNQMKAAWLATPADQKGALTETCKQATEAAKASLQAYGCTL